MGADEAAQARKRILHAAALLFAARGVDVVSMREIAAAVDLSKPGLYYYFEDKQTLVLALLVENLDTVSALVEDALLSAPDVRQRLTRLLHGFFGLPPEQRSMIRLASRSLPILGMQARRAFDRTYQQKFIRRLEHLLQEGMTRKELRKMDPKRATWILLGMLYPFFNAETGDGGDPTEEMVAVFLDGLQNRPAE